MTARTPIRKRELIWREVEGARGSMKEGEI